MTQPMKTLLAGATMAALATTAAAQDSGGYGILMKTLSNPFWSAMSGGAEEEAKTLKLDYYLQAAASDQAAEEQLNICNTMLERKPAAMVTAAINSTNLLPCLKAAQADGVRVVDLDGNLDPAILTSEGIDIAFTIGSDNVAAGGKAAEFIAQRLGADATGPVLVIEGLSGNVTGQKRAQGFADTLATMAPGLEIVASLPGDWDRGKAANVTNDILTRNPDLKAIFAANDGMALGAVESVFAAGKGGDVVVVGVDGNSDAVASIKDGRLTASVAQLPYLVGKQAVENVAKVVGGETVEASIVVPTLVLTKDLLEKGGDPLLEYVR